MQINVSLAMSSILSALISAALLRKTCCASCTMYCCSCVNETDVGCMLLQEDTISIDVLRVCIQVPELGPCK